MRRGRHEDTRFTAGLLIGIAAGAVAGGLLGLVSAPARGATMRRALRMRVHRLEARLRRPGALPEPGTHQNA